MNSGSSMLKQCAHDWNVAEATVIAAGKTMNAKWKIPSSDYLNILFLCAKNAIPLNFDLKKLINPVTEKEKSVKQRLVRMVTSGDEYYKKIQEGVQSFEEFCSEPSVSAWGDRNKSWVFWRESPSVVLVQRSQQLGLCYFHSVDCLQNYLVSKYKKAPTDMLDMGEFMRKYFSPDQIMEHIFNDRGGNGEIVLKQIMIPKTITTLGRDVPFTENFHRYGPGFIPSMEVYKDFLENQSVHLEEPGGADDFVGHHSVLVMGYRFTEKGELRLLVQNWWNGKQFFETNEEYLEKHSAAVWFVKTPQTEVPNQFLTHPGSFFTNQNDRATVSGYTDGKTYL